MKKLLLFTGLSLLVLSVLNLLGSFGLMNEMMPDFTWRDVNLYGEFFELTASVSLAILCFSAARRQPKER